MGRIVADTWLQTAENTLLLIVPRRFFIPFLDHLYIAKVGLSLGNGLTAGVCEVDSRVIEDFCSFFRRVPDRKIRGNVERVLVEDSLNVCSSLCR